jgi:protein involved in polysaccharide export with SLBB domain
MTGIRKGRRPIPWGLVWLIGIGCFAFGGRADAQAAWSDSDVAAAMTPTGRATLEEMAAQRGVSEAQVGRLLDQGVAEIDSVPEAAPPPPDRIEQAPKEITQVSQPEGESSLVPFGYSLFENSPESFRQPAFGPADPEYPLGPGDEIVLEVWGDTEFRVERTLDREGGVNLPDVGRVVLAGLTLDEVRETMRRRLSRFYSGLSESDANATTHLSITLGNLRVIRVFVVGRGRRPGGYDLSAASTVFHALFFAGGPLVNGSLRDIRVVRGGKEVAVLDVYEYLRTGRRDGDVRLENDDTIFIPPVGPRVTVQGEIRQPGVYETLPGESLQTVLETAGGFTETAFPGRIQVERILTASEQETTGEDRRLLDWSFDRDGAQSLRDGDIVSVFPIAKRMQNFVKISGEVRRPGTYELNEETTLSQILQQAGGLLETAFLKRAEVVRTYDDLHREQISVNLAEVRTDPSKDVTLFRRDEIKIYSIWDLQDSPGVSIYGAVREPGSFELREGMSLADVILQAGGPLESAHLTEVEISRVEPGAGTETSSARVLHVSMGDDYLSGDASRFRLMPYDNVFIREKPYYELQRNVAVRGEVRYPGVYTLQNPRETVAEIIERAGGLKPTAFPEGFALTRSKDDLGRVALDLERALKKPDSNDNIILFAGDSLFVPEEPRTVTVRGAVGYPTSLVYSRGWSIGDYIERAGGTNEKADKGQVRVVYSTGAAARVKKLWFDPEVLPGSTIIVPEKSSSGTDWGTVIRETTSVLASLATVALVVDRVSD